MNINKYNFKKVEYIATMCSTNSDKYEWLVDINKNAFYKKKIGEPQIDEMRVFETEHPLREKLYSEVIYSNEKLFFVPHYAQQIAVLDLNSDEMVYLKLREEPSVGRKSIKFWRALEWNECIYMFGYAFPSILKMNVNTLEISYIDDWLNHITNREKIDIKKGYFADGYVVIGDKMYLPMGCTNAICEMDLLNEKTRVIDIKSNLDGIGGLALIDENHFIMVGRGLNTNRLVLFDIITEELEELVIPDMDDTIFDPFYAPIKHGNDVLLIPISAKAIYKYSIANNNVENCLEYSSLFSEMNDCVCRWKILDCKHYGKYLLLETGHDLKWHKIDLEKNCIESWDMKYPFSKEVYYSKLKEVYEVGTELFFEKEGALDFFLYYIETSGENV